MWISKQKFEELERKVNLLQRDRDTLTNTVNLLLKHLHLKLWTEPPQSEKIELITEKEYDKKPKLSVDNYLLSQQQQQIFKNFYSSLPMK